MSADVFCREGNDRDDKGFVQFVQVFHDKAAKTLNITSLASYTVHIVLLTSSVMYWQCLVENGVTLVESLPAKIKMSEKSERRSEARGAFAHYWFNWTGG